MQYVFEIENLHAKVEQKTILKGFNLKVKAGEIHAIMGPNGAGKSTLAKIISGHPAYEVVSGHIRFRGKDILELDPEERAHLGLFVSFQYPPEIPGVSNTKFLLAAINAQLKAKGEPAVSEADFAKQLAAASKLVEMRADLADRNLNEGFSGGEKKRNEILQMALLQPVVSVLDETDSGLDIDAMRIVAHGVNQLMSQDKALLVITHYQRLLDYIKPHFVHVLVDGAIVHSGGPELALELEERGYDWLMPQKGGAN